MITRIQGDTFAMYDIKESNVLMLPTSKKDIAPTIELAEAYQAIYDYYNVALFKRTFGQPLPRCILNMSRQRGAVAFFMPKSFRDPMSGDLLDEISLVPEWLGRDPREVLSTICHEMAHFKDSIDGTAAKGAYHGRSWFKLMARLGLPGRPLSKTMLRVTHDIEPGGAFERAFKAMPQELVLPFTTARPASGYKKAKPDNLQGKRAKYQCGVCGTVIRGKSGLNIGCLDCDDIMHEIGF